MNRIRIGRQILLPLALVALLFSTTLLTAQPDEGPDALPGETVGSDFYNNTYFAIGTRLSLLSGSGLSGRITFPNRIALQLTSFVISIGGITHFNAGFEGQYAFSQFDGGRLYGLVGGGYYLSNSDEPTKPGNRINSPVHLGIGVGYEAFLSRYISLDIGLPFTWFIEDAAVGPIPSVSLHYYFK